MNYQGRLKCLLVCDSVERNGKTNVACFGLRGDRLWDLETRIEDWLSN